MVWLYLRYTKWLIWLLEWDWSWKISIWGYFLRRLRVWWCFVRWIWRKRKQIWPSNSLTLGNMIFNWITWNLYVKVMFKLICLLFSIFTLFSWYFFFLWIITHILSFWIMHSKIDHALKFTKFMLIELIWIQNSTFIYYSRLQFKSYIYFEAKKKSLNFWIEKYESNSCLSVELETCSSNVGIDHLN